LALLVFWAAGHGVEATSPATVVQAPAPATEFVNPKDFGAIADGRSHPLSTVYGSLAAAQAVYPFVTSLQQEIDYAAVKQASNLALGPDNMIGAYKTMAGTSTTTMIVDAADGYPVNSLVGQNLFLRYPNAFIDSRVIVANTATTITIQAAFADFHNGANNVCGFGQTFDCSSFAIGNGEHGFFNAKLNKAIYLPGGTYVFGNDTWLIRNASGARIVGEGRTATVLTSNRTVFATDGLWYSIIEGITFKTLTTTAVVAVDIDGNVPGHPYETRSVQGNTFRNDQFDGGGGTYALALCRQGGSSAQGESSFIEDHWMNADTAFLITGFNNLANLVLRGDMQNYNTGINLVAGSVQVVATSFESTRGYAQVAARGFDIHAGEAGVGEKIVVSGCRTESLQFFKGSSTQPGVLIANIQGSSQPDWQPGHRYSINDTTMPLVNVNGVRFRRLFRVTRAGKSEGVTGATDMFSANTIGHTGYAMVTNHYQGYDLTITGGSGAGQTRVIATNTPTTAVVTQPWAIVPDKTSTFTISRPPVWPASGTFVDGEVEWTQTNFYSVDGTSINNTGAFTLLNNEFLFTSIAEWRSGDSITLPESADFTQPFFAYQSLTFLGDSSNGAFTVTLPAAPIGQIITVKKIEAGPHPITVAGQGTTIDGAPSVVIPAGSRGYLTLHYAGRAGYVIVGKSF
jgi:hypothetical protein